MEMLSLSEFLKAGLTPYHVTKTVASLLAVNGFCHLSEKEPFSLSRGGKYFVTRADASVIAFVIPEDFSGRGFQIAAAHSDSPAFHITGERHDGHYVRLSVEKYGGLLCGTYFDRPLKIAGRVFLRTPHGMRGVLYQSKTPVVIPSVAPHQNKEANERVMADPAVDLLPLFSKDDGPKALRRSVAETLNVCESDILSHDLYLVFDAEPTVWGDDFITSPRLDDLACVYGLLEGFFAAIPTSAVPVLAILAGEEIGSMTPEGADSTFLSDILTRICAATKADLSIALAGSFFLSVDNAHGVHPSHPELFDGGTPCYLNGGIVIKHNASRRYTTDGFSAGLLRLLCEDAGVPVQEYRNRADLPGGATLGAIANTHVSVPSADIGLAQLAMHSANETGGLLDVRYLSLLAKRYFSTARISDGNTHAWGE